MSEPVPVTPSSWDALRQFTDARIALGRSGISLPTEQLLEFQLAHAQAIDAVHTPLDVEALEAALDELPHVLTGTAPLPLHSKAQDRTTYLQRPDLGRTLDDESRRTIADALGEPAPEPDLALVIVDGLSSRAIQENAAPFLDTLLGTLAEREGDAACRLAPLSVVLQGRVAIGDHVGQLMNAKSVLVLIGERPGLSSPDSLGLYFTYGPEVGLTDARRNCISNVRARGLSYTKACERVLYLYDEARRQQISGVTIKDRSSDAVIEHDGEPQHFLASEQDEKETRDD